MQQNKVVRILAKLPEKEIKVFGKYLSNIYSPGSVLYRLLEHIRKYHPECTAKQLGAEQIFSKIYPREIFDKKRLLNQFSLLKKELKRFLIWYHQEDFSYESNIILLQLYKRYQLNDHVEKQLLDMCKKLEESPEKDMWYWQQKMQLAHEDYHYIANNRIRPSPSPLKEAMKQLDNFYAIAKLRYSVEYYNQEQVLNPEPEIPVFLQEIHEMEKETSSSVVHHAYQLALLLIRERSEVAFEQLKDVLLAYSEQFSEDDQLILNTYLFNHISAGLKKGKFELVEPAFRLFQQGIKQRLFVKDGYFEGSHFDNIINVGCALKEFDWIDSFVKEWQDTLNPEIKEDTLLMADAFISFRKKDFKATENKLVALSQRQFKHAHHKARYKLLDLATLFESAPQSEYLISRYLALEKSVRDNKTMGKDMKVGILNFVKVIRKLSRSKVDKPKLVALMASFKILYFKFWLKEKVEAY